MLPARQRTGLAKGQAEPPRREETQAQQKAETEAVQGQHGTVLRKREVVILEEEVVAQEVLRPVIPGPILLPAVAVEQIKVPVQVAPALPEVTEAVVENLLVQEEVRHGI